MAQRTVKSVSELAEDLRKEGWNVAKDMEYASACGIYRSRLEYVLNEIEYLKKSVSDREDTKYVVESWLRCIDRITADF